VSTIDEKKIRLGGRDFGQEERYNVDWRPIRNLSRLGPGRLVDEESRVLTWLE